MHQKIENGAAENNVLDGGTDRGKKPRQRPAAGAEGPDVADGAHGDFDEATFVAEGLRVGLGGDDRVDYIARCVSACLALPDPSRRDLVAGIFAADPGEAQIEKHFL